MSFEKPKIYGAVGSAIACGIVLLLLFLIYMPIHAKEDEGIMISFGDSDFGAGFGDFPSSSSAGQPAYKPTVTEDITQNYEESLVIAEQKRKEREQREEAENLRREQERIAREQQQAIDRANEIGGLFGSGGTGGSGGVGGNGSGAGITQGIGSGYTTGDGKQGNPLGQGSQGGNSWSLDGRSLNGDLVKPTYNLNKEGAVVVEIRVDKTGKVISTKAPAIGTTIPEAELHRAAEKAALATRFSPGKNEAVGTITYNFRLK